MSGKDAAATASQLETYISTESREESYAEGGAFLPLGVWSTRGFDTRAIEDKTATHDVQDHPILGKCYRVVITTKESTAKRCVTRQSEVSSSSARAAPTARDVLAIEDGKASSSSSSSKNKKDKKAVAKDVRGACDLAARLQFQRGSASVSAVKQAARPHDASTPWMQLQSPKIACAPHQEKEKAKLEAQKRKANTVLVKFASKAALQLSQVTVQIQTLVEHQFFFAVPDVVAAPLKKALEDCGQRVAIFV